MTKWIPVEDGATIGKTGTENGIIVRDEQWPHMAGITLEEDAEKASITCGLYGSFVHTAFTSLEDGPRKYEAMKTALENSPDDSDELMDWIDWFVTEF